MKVNGFGKVFIGFVIGASTVGGIATAAGTFSDNGANVCATSSGALYAQNSDGSCDSGQSKISITNGSIKSIVQKVSPAVVTVNVSLGNGQGDTGSGSIIQSSGSTSYVLTNNHVVESADGQGTIKIETDSGDQYSATIVGRDVNYDLAVLKVNKGNLATITIGDSSSLAIGDPVIAFGSPLGLNGTVTSGIVSALNRPVVTQGTSVNSYVNAIQTDAAINPGNSGGALTDSAGRLVGINSAIASTGANAGNVGLGFAIPINEAKRVYTEIITRPDHKSTRPILGVYFDNNYTGVGARVIQLSKGEAAEAAGIPVGAVITKIDDKRISDQLSAIVKIRSYTPGTTVKVTVNMPNGGGTKVFTVKLGATTN